MEEWLALVHQGACLSHHEFAHQSGEPQGVCNGGSFGEKGLVVEEFSVVRKFGMVVIVLVNGSKGLEKRMIGVEFENSLARRNLLVHRFQDSLHVGVQA